MQSTAKAARNVKVTVEIEMYVPDAAAEGPVGGVDDPTWERASDYVYAIWEAGDPADLANAVVFVNGIDWIGSDEPA